MVSIPDAKNLKHQMSLPDLVFMTKENEEQIKKRVSPEILAQFAIDGEARIEANRKARDEAFDKLEKDKAVENGQA